MIPGFTLTDRNLSRLLRNYKKKNNFKTQEKPFQEFQYLKN